MPRYRIRTRPDVVVDAFQITKPRWSNARLARRAGVGSWPDWLKSAFGPAVTTGGLWWGRGKQQGKLVLGTADGGRAVILPGWWVIRDPKGQISVTDPASFDAAYEPVEG